MKKEIYCCGCEKPVMARLTNGREIYPHRQDLYELPFWKCDTCKNYVGCHWKTKDRTRPLGVIPTRAIMEVRKKIHEKLDPLWKYGIIPRKKLYAQISKELGYSYHNGELKSVQEGERVYEIVMKICSSHI